MPVTLVVISLMSETMAYVATAASTQYYSHYNEQNNYCVYCYKDITARGGSRVLEGSG